MENYWVLNFAITYSLGFLLVSCLVGWFWFGFGFFVWLFFCGGRSCFVCFFLFACVLFCLLIWCKNVSFILRHSNSIISIISFQQWLSELILNLWRPCTEAKTEITYTVTWLSWVQLIVADLETRAAATRLFWCPVTYSSAQMKNTCRVELFSVSCSGSEVLLFIKS